MSDTSFHGVPPLLAAMATYCIDQTHLATLDAALDTARIALQADDIAAREAIREDFIGRDGHDRYQMEDMTPTQHTAALVQYGDAGYLLGFATCWLLLTSGQKQALQMDGAR